MLLRARIVLPVMLLAAALALRMDRLRGPLPGDASGVDGAGGGGVLLPAMPAAGMGAGPGIAGIETAPSGAKAWPGLRADAAPAAPSWAAADLAFERRRADARAFLVGLYREFLGREGDEAAIGLWADLIAAGTLTREQAVEHFLDASPAFQAAAPIARLYLAAFERAPDEAGWRHWRSLLVSGLPLDAIGDAFAASEEFASLHGALADGPFVEFAYRNTLGRDPTPGELAHWQSRLASGLLTRGGVLLAMTESPEFRSAVASEVDASVLYSALLGRSADLPGFAAWMRAAREQRLTRAAMIAGFLDSPEYRARAATAGSPR